MKPRGQVAIIEYKEHVRLSLLALLKHYTPLAVILRDMEAAGYEQVQAFDILPKQTFNVFALKSL
jgi:hypothetical protein